jgi:hypothetical protein
VATHHGGVTLDEAALHQLDEAILLEAVPDLAGLMWADAVAIAERRGFWVRKPEPDEAVGEQLAIWMTRPKPEEAMAMPTPAVGGVVVDQAPRPGAHVPLGSWLTLWTEDGPDPRGVREPRRPNPRPLAGEAEENAAASATTIREP